MTLVAFVGVLMAFMSMILVPLPFVSVPFPTMAFAPRTASFPFRWPMYPVQRTSKVFYLPLIRDLLPFSQFNKLQHFFHLVHYTLERIDDFHDLPDGRADGRTLQFPLATDLIRQS